LSPYANATFSVGSVSRLSMWCGAAAAILHIAGLRHRAPHEWHNYWFPLDFFRALRPSGQRQVVSAVHSDEQEGKK